MLEDNSIRFLPVKVQKNKILRHKFLNYLPQKYKLSVHPICTTPKKPPVFTDDSRFKKQTNDGYERGRDEAIRTSLPVSSPASLPLPAYWL